MILVTGRVHVPAEHSDRFTEVATEMCSRSRREQGCIGYRVYSDLEQADRYVFVEEWADDVALQRHFGEPHTRAFLDDLGGMLNEPGDVLFHTTASTRRLEQGRGLVPVEE